MAGFEAKPRPHTDPADTPRRRADNRRGHGTFGTDRSPIVGVVGRDSGQERTQVVERADGATLVEVVEGTTPEGATIYTDEWDGYNDLPGMKRHHVRVSHAGPGRRASGHEATTELKCATCIPRPRRGSGRDRGTSCGRSAG